MAATLRCAIHHIGLFGGQTSLFPPLSTKSGLSVDALAAAESEASHCVELADAVGLQPPEILHSGGGAR